MNRTNTVNFDAHWTSGAKKGRFFSDFLSNRLVVKFSPLKDVRAHCYCASLVRTLFIRHVLPRHVFQARAPSRNSTKYSADDLCVNMVCEYFCWRLGDPHFFSADDYPFLILFVTLKNKKNLYVGSFKSKCPQKSNIVR